MMNLGRRGHYYNNKNRIDSMTEASHMIKGIIKTLAELPTLEMRGIEVNIIEVIEETLRIEPGHIIDLEVGIEIIDEDLLGMEETVDLGIEVMYSITINLSHYKCSVRSLIN